MEIIKATNIDFLKQRGLFFGLSAFLILAGIVSLIAKGGPNLGIDFSGGILMQVMFDKPVSMDELRSTMSATKYRGLDLQSSQGNAVIFRLKKADFTQDEFQKDVENIVKEKFPGTIAVVERVEFVGPTVGKHLLKQATLAMILSMLGIILYVGVRFNSGVWGIAGVIALAHDVFVVFGLFSIFNKEITLTVVAALLTLAGFSINDTIVIFDRIREKMRLLRKDDFGIIINKSINETLSRTAITNGTVFIVVAALFFFGGEVIHDFSFAMLVGCVIGSYSTVYIASPMVYEWYQFQKRKVAELRKGVAQKGAAR